MQLSNETLTPQIDIPALMFHDTADNVTPVEDSRAIAKVWKKHSSSRPKVGSPRCVAVKRNSRAGYKVFEKLNWQKYCPAIRLILPQIKRRFGGGKVILQFPQSSFFGRKTASRSGGLPRNNRWAKNQC